MLKKCLYVFDAKHKRRLLLLFLMILVGSWLELLGVSAVLPLVKLVSSSEQVSDSIVLLEFLPPIRISNMNTAIMWCAIFLIGVYVLKNLFLCLMYYCQYSFVFHGQRELACQLMNCYIHQNYLFHVSHNVADLQRNVTDDARHFFTVIQAVLELLTEVTVCLILVCYLLFNDFATTFVVMALVSVYLLFYFLFVRRKITTLGRENRTTLSFLNKLLLQSFGGIKEIKVFRREDYFLENYGNTYGTYASIQTKQQFMGILPRPIMETVSIAGLMGSLAVQVVRGEEYAKFVPLLSIFVVAAVRMLPSFSRVASCINTISFYKSSVEALYNDLVEANKIKWEVNEHRKKEDNLSYMGDIELKNVSFSYPNMDRIILKNISFTIKNMSSVAFVGESGAGKTTLADVILGVLEPEAGEIIVNGNNIYDHLDSWLSEIGYIPQTVYLTDDTIAANIAFGIPQDEINQEKLYTAIKRAQLEKFVNELPDKENTVIGDRGVRLSGGQRQRIGIARALYNEPSILILDEATSALDNETEEAVMEAISLLQGNITIIIIAHRLSTIRNCDVVYEICNGNAIERDTKEYLENKK